MRIVHVTDTLNMGGAERIAVDLANYMAKEGYNTFFCTTRAAGPLEHELERNITFINLRRRKTFDGLLRFRKFVCDNYISIIHAHGNSTATFCVLALWGLDTVRIVHHDHNSNIDQRNWLVHKLILKRVHTWIAVSSQIFEWVQSQVGHSRIRKMINPIQISRFRQNRTGGDHIKQIAILANYREPKDYLNLIDAVKILKETTGHFKINAFGGKADLAYYDKISERIRQLKLDDAISLNATALDVPKVLCNSDLALLSSSREGLPVSLLEYMASYLPVVVTDVGECKRIVLEADCGVVVPPSNPSALARGIHLVLENEENWNLWGMNGRGFIERNHSIDTFVRTLITDVYEQE